MGESYGPIVALHCPGLLPKPFNRIRLKKLYGAGGSCIAGQEPSAVPLSGFARTQ
jgi:hypothetical protein